MGGTSKNEHNDILKFLSLNGMDAFSCNDIIIFLGAGASVDADIPMLSKILDVINKQLIAELDLAKQNLDFRFGKSERDKKADLLAAERNIALFNYFKTKCPSADYSLNTSANIEDILALMNDVVSMKTGSNLYNVIGEWEKELVEASRDNFSFLKKLIKKIEEIIKEELKIKEIKEAQEIKERAIAENETGIKEASKAENKAPANKLNYFNFIFYLQRKMKDSVLNIFTLNHDLTIETAYGRYLDEISNAGYPEEIRYELETGFSDDYKLVETGFSDGSKHHIYCYDNADGRPFNLANFDRCVDKKPVKHINLYKLHGSINWERLENTHKVVLRNPDKANEDSNKQTNDKKTTEIIFGVSQKYKSTEPYSSLYHEFKRKLGNKNLKLVVIVGYGFNDRHINDAITSAMENNDDLKLCITNPIAAETYFFSHPELLHHTSDIEKLIIHGGVIDKDKNKPQPKNASADSNYKKGIVETEDFEEYMNITDAMYSAYYSRNFDEDALFLAICLEQIRENEDNFMDATKAADYKIGTQWLTGLFEDNIEEPAFKFDLDKVRGEFDNTQKRNQMIYNRLFSNSLSVQNDAKEKPKHEEMLKRISEMKTELYDFLLNLRAAKTNKDFDEISKTCGISSGELESRQEIYIRCFLELREDLRVIEKFIETFIPIHLYLTFYYIKQYNLTKNEYEEKKNSANKITKHLEEIPGDELLSDDLKRHKKRLTDDLEATLVARNKFKRSTNNLSIVVLELFLKYNYFIGAIKIQLAGESGKPKKDWESLIQHYRDLLGEDYTDAFQNVLSCKVNGSDSYQKRCELINGFLTEINNQIVDPKVPKFREDLFLTWRNDAEKTKHAGNFLLQGVLHKKDFEGKENLLQIKVQLYTKALCKSMIGRTEHKKRLLTDITQLVKVGTNKTQFAAWEKKIHEYAGKELSQKKRGTRSEGFPSSELIIENHGDEYFNDFPDYIKKELGLRINSNTNSYLHYNYKNLYVLLKSHYRLRFDRFENNEKFMEKLNDNFSDGKDKDELTKWIDTRVIFKHFAGKLFFSKELRILNMFKYYNSTFHSSAYTNSFNNPDKAISHFLNESKRNRLGSQASKE